MQIVLAIDGSEGARWAQDMVVALPLPGGREVTLWWVREDWGR